MKELLFLMLVFSFSSKALAQKDCVGLRRSAFPAARSINIVFVNSGFNDGLDEFESQVNTIWSTIESTFPPFSQNVSSLNVQIAKLPHPGSSFCAVDPKYGLVCDYGKSKGLSSKCSQGAAKEITVVLHNSLGVWLRGTTTGTIISISTHQRTPFTLAHEFGHAIFDLADEYDYGGDANRANCSSKAQKCSAWQDLINAGLATCEAGCKSKSALINGNFIMKNADVHDYGHADQRLICCKYKTFTGSFPSFCEEYRHIGAGLENFCRSNP